MKTLTPELQAEFEKFCARIPVPADPEAWSEDQAMAVGFMCSILGMSIELDAWLTEQLILQDKRHYLDSMDV